MWTVIRQDELYHHGILGMKWGKQNGPPYPLGSGDHSASEKKAGWRKSLSGGSDGGHNYARKIKKELNRLDKKQTKAIYERNTAEYQEAKANAKGSYEKAGKWAAKKSEWEDFIKESEKETWKLIADAASAGYDVSSKKGLRDVNAGKRMTAQLLGGIIGSTAFNSYKLASSGQTGLVEGNKFKVKKSENDIPSITIDQRSSKLAERQEAYRQKRLDSIAEKSLKKSFDKSIGKMSGSYTEKNRLALERFYPEVKAKREAIDKYDRTHDSDNEKVGGKSSKLTRDYMDAVDRAVADYESKHASKTALKRQEKMAQQVNYPKKFSGSQKATMYEAAKKRDSYDLDFLEMVQNKDISYNSGSKGMLDAYKKYLTNPQNFEENELKKLKDV